MHWPKSQYFDKLPHRSAWPWDTCWEDTIWLHGNELSQFGLGQAKQQCTQKSQAQDNPGSSWVALHIKSTPPKKVSNIPLAGTVTKQLQECAPKTSSGHAACFLSADYWGMCRSYFRCHESGPSESCLPPHFQKMLKNSPFCMLDRHLIRESTQVSPFYVVLASQIISSKCWVLKYLIGIYRFHLTVTFNC